MENQYVHPALPAQLRVCPSSCGAANYAAYTYFIDEKFRGKAMGFFGWTLVRTLCKQATQGQVTNKPKYIFILYLFTFKENGQH